MSIFKDCDIRGVYKEELDEASAYEIGRALGTTMEGKTMVVGGDARVSTPALKESLIKGLYDSGARILDIGMVPTPIFYFAKSFLKVDGGVTVTASHNPAKYNGFKITMGDMPVKPEDIYKLEEIVKNKAYSEAKGEIIDISHIDINEEYKNFVKKLTKSYGKLKVVIDAGNGATSKIAPEIFREFGYEVVELFCEFDGTFPNREPNPAVYKNLEKLQEKVLETHADLGVAFDGDGDRVVFVDEKGRISVSEESLVVFIREYLKDKPSSVVYDIKSSSIVKRETEKYNSKAIMERSGHAFIKRTFLNNDSALAGEISGHFFFKELGHDDGIYGALKMAEILTKNKMSLGEYADSIEKTLMTPDLRIPYPREEQIGLLNKVESLKSKYTVSKLDGVRVQFEKGWALIRQSVTEPIVTIRFEAENEAEMSKIKEEFLSVVPELRGKHEALN